MTSDRKLKASREARNEGSTGPKRLDDTRCTTYKRRINGQGPAGGDEDPEGRELLLADADRVRLEPRQTKTVVVLLGSRVPSLQGASSF